MNIEEMFPRRWLSADDLQGRQAIAEIAAVNVEPIRNPRTNREEPRLIVSFVGKQKRLICNKTQAYTIAGITNSRETADWQGCRVTLAPATAPNGHLTIAIGRAPAKVAAPATNGAEAPEQELTP